MSWLPLQSFPSGADLSALSHYLQQLDIPHRFTDELQHQILWVPDPSWRQRAEQALHTFARDPAAGRLIAVKAVPPAPLALPPFRQAMVTYLTITLCVLGYGLIFLPVAWVNKFEFIPFSLNSANLKVVWHYWQNTAEYWRILTPAFIHWGLLHIVFNSLWMLELGKRLEHYLNTGVYLLLLVFLAIGGNFAQFLWTPEHPFGGISSVVYGLLGFVAVMQRFDNATELALPRSLLIFMVVWIVIGVLGIFDAILGHMANGGHLGGLILGICAALFYRLTIWSPQKIDDE